MKLHFQGHDYKYAAEQMLLTLFPDQRPDYPEGEPCRGEDGLVLSLCPGGRWLTATAKLTWQGKEYRSCRRCPVSVLQAPELERDRACQRILKLAFSGRAPRPLARSRPGAH